MDLYTELEWRGMISEVTEGLHEVLARQTVTGYIGFDPTASSLHVGSLLPVMALARLQYFGHKPIAIVGGGTGLIGDPSGKTQERTLLTPEEIDRNLDGLRTQLARFLDFEGPVNAARIINNADWLSTIDLMTFLRETGKHFTVNYMLAKESVKRRLQQQEGLSFTEFSYALLQAYDFLVLHDRYGCTLQLGGSDQWGNITAGCDLVRKLRGRRVHGLVLPLVTSASGVKFGKTEAGTVWLDPARTSPFRFYQFWLNTDDSDVMSYLKYFTFLDQASLREIETEATLRPDKREAQRRLAQEVTRMVHGEEAVRRAERASRVLFGEEVSELNVEEVLEVFEDVPSTEIAMEELEGTGAALVDLLARVGLASSKSEATRLVRSGGVYVNSLRVVDERTRLTCEQAIAGQLFLLRKGQRQNHLLKIRQDRAPAG